jgi:hypothetical protein
MGGHEMDYWSEVHGHFVTSWRLISHLIQDVKPGSYSEEDKLLFTPKYQKVIAQTTVKFLEKDFLDG